MVIGCAPTDPSSSSGGSSSQQSQPRGGAAFGDADVKAWGGTAAELNAVSVAASWTISSGGKTYTGSFSEPLASFLAGRTVDFNGDQVPDAIMQMAVRADGSGTHIDNLLSENFALKPDSGSTYTLAGLDFVASRATVAPSGGGGVGGGTVGGGTLPGDLPGGGGVEIPGSTDFDAASFQVSLNMPVTRSDNSAGVKRISLRSASLEHNAEIDIDARFPERSAITVGFRPAVNPDDGGFLLYDGDSTYTANRQPLVHGLEVADLTGDTVDERSHDVIELRWAQGPQDFAAGFHSLCDPTSPSSQMGWNQFQPVVQQQSDKDDLVLDVVKGPAQAAQGANDMDLTVGFRGVARRLDTVFRRRAITVGHSFDTPTDLSALDLTSRPTLGEPFVLHSEVDNLPSRTTVDATSLVHGVTFCDGAALTEPCGNNPSVPADRVQVDLANFLAGDSRASGLPNPPEEGSYVLVGANDMTDTCPANTTCPAPAMRFAAQLTKLRSASITKISRNGFRVAGDLAAAQTTRVEVRLDSRTNKTNDYLNRGSLLSADAVITQLPSDKTTLTYDSNGISPLILHGETSHSIAGIRALVSAQWPGPSALMLNDVVTLGDPASTSSMLPTTFAAKWKETLHTNGPTSTTSDAITYSANGKLRVRVDASLSDYELRSHSLATWLWTDTVIPESVAVNWSSRSRAGGPSTIDHVDLTACPSGGTCGNDIDAVVARLPVTCQAVLGCQVVPRDEKGRPLLPEGTGQALHPAFTPWSLDEQGVKAVIDGDKWGVHAHIRNLRSVSYEPSPQTLCVTTAPDDARFLLDVYMTDAPATLWADTILSRLPANLGVRIADDGGNDTTPWLITSSTGCGDLDATAPKGANPPANAPRIDALLRYGDRPAPLVALGVNGGEGLIPQTGSRPDPTAGIEARALVGSSIAGTSGDSAAVWAHIHEVVPKKLMIWKPLSSSCEAVTCQGLPRYEIDAWKQYGFRYDSDLLSLGPLDAVVRAWATGNDPADKAIGVSVKDLPGQLTGTLRFTKNRRFPRTVVVADLNGNAQIGRLAVQVTDHLSPAHYGEQGDTANAVIVPNYSAVVHNLPKTLHIESALYDGDPQTEIADPPKPPAPAGCAAAQYSPPTRSMTMAYLHTDINLDYKVSNVKVTVNNHADDRPEADDQKMVAVRGANANGDPARFKAVRLDTRLDHVVIDQHESKSTLIGNADVDVCLDLDLPLYLFFHDRSELRLGNNAATITTGILPGEGSLQDNHPTIELSEHDLATAIPDTTLDQRVTPMGAFYRRHYTFFNPPDPMGDWTLDHGPGREDIEFLQSDPLRKEDIDGFIRSDDGGWPPNTGGFWPAAAADKAGRFRWTDEFMDLLWDKGHRAGIHDTDVANPVAAPGVKLYKAVLDKMPSAFNLNEPEPPTTTQVKSGQADFDLAQLCGDVDAEDAKPIWKSTGAVNSDGTTYRATLDCYASRGDAIATQLRFQAVWPKNTQAVPQERQRWLSQTPVWQVECTIDDGHDCTVHISVSPDGETGGVSTAMSVSRKQGTKVWLSPYDAAGAAWYDASGIPGRRTELSGATVADPHRDAIKGYFSSAIIGCAKNAEWVCAAPPQGSLRYFVFGDGTIQQSQATSAFHAYPGPGRYTAMVVERSAQGKSRQETYDVNVIRGGNVRGTSG